MKLALFGIVIGLVLAACSINHRSGDYACTQQSDCSTGRTCDNGFCVINGSIDAPGHGPDARTDGGTGCPAGCTSCNVGQKTCTVDCSLTNCSGALSCPAGYHCDFQCKGDSSCRGGISCSVAASCTIECIGGQSCRGIQCGPGPCDVMCSGTNSCRDVSCGPSCACDVSCTGSQSCTSGTIQCTSAACRSTLGLGCTSVPALCHSCM